MSIANTTITNNECVTSKEPNLKNTLGKKGMINFRAMKTVVIEDEPKSKTVLKFTKPLR